MIFHFNAIKEKIFSNFSRDTILVGEEIGKNLGGGEVVFLYGILGAGKTVLVRGIAQVFGIKSRITSPTFNIFRAYDIPRGGKLYHFDCYRLKKYADLVELGWEEILADPSAAVVLEWPECVADKDVTKLSGKKMILIEIKIRGNERIIAKIERAG